MISDPAGLLQRMPELEPLCEDPKVRAAVERGDPFKVYNALRWARLLGRLPRHREALKALLNNRRLFMRSLSGNPTLFTLNSVGVGFTGSSERNAEDGTYITHHAIVVLFAIPVIPLGAYLVREVQSRRYQIFGKVPMGGFMWLWSRGIAFAVLAAIAGGGLSAYKSSRYRDVWVTNGFSQPVTVALGGKTATVPANGRALLEDVAVGPQHAVAKGPEGLVVEEMDTRIPVGSNTYLWNVAGSAPVYLIRIEYYSGKVPENAPEPQPEVLCGKSFSNLPPVDYAFVPPAKQVTMPDHQNRTSRMVLGMEQPDKGDSGAELCEIQLELSNRQRNAFDLMVADARLKKWPKDAGTRAILEAAKLADGDPVSVAREAVAAHPDELWAHRTLSWVAELKGQLEPLTAEYKVAADKAPESSRAQYLYARLLKGRAGDEALVKLGERFPKDADIARAVVSVHANHARWAEAHAAFERLRALDDSAVKEVGEEEVTALVALGRGEDALELSEGLYRQSDEDDRSDVAVLHARVSKSLGRTEEDPLIAEVIAEKSKKYGHPADDLSALLHARAGLAVGEKAPDIAQVIALSGKDGAEARARISKLAPIYMNALPIGTWALLYADAVRAADEEAKTKLASLPALSPEDARTVEKLVSGGQVSDDEVEELRVELRAAALFERSLNPSVPATERASLRRRAADLDPLRSATGQAVRTWKL